MDGRHHAAGHRARQPGQHSRATRPRVHCSPPPRRMRRFQCSLDSAPFAACTSPRRVDVTALGAAQVQRPRGRRGGERRSDAGRVLVDERPDRRRSGPKVTIFAAPRAKASSASPVLKAAPTPASARRSPTRSRNYWRRRPSRSGTRLHAQWKSDSSAVSYDVTVTTCPRTRPDRRARRRRDRGQAVLPHEANRAAADARRRHGLHQGRRARQGRQRVGDQDRLHHDPGLVRAVVGPVHVHRVRDAKAWRGYYIVLGHQDYLIQPIGDGAFFRTVEGRARRRALPGCGRVELAFTKYPWGAKRFAPRDGRPDRQDRSPGGGRRQAAAPAARARRQRLRRALRAGGKPRVSGVGFTD